MNDSLHTQSAEITVHNTDQYNSTGYDVNGDDGESRYAELVTIENCTKGLGLKICGGCSPDGSNLYGIFIKFVIPGGVAANSGLLQNGDQILSVNGESLEGVTKDRAISVLRRAAGDNHAEILISRDFEARSEFIEVLERENSLLTSTPNHMVKSGSFEDSLDNGENYLNGSIESPWKQFATSPTLIATTDDQTPGKTSLTRKTTLDPSDKLDLDKLLGKLQYLKLEPTSAKLKELYQYLIIDAHNQVTFGNFMRAVKIVFEEELNGRKSINNSSVKSSPSVNSQDVVTGDSGDFHSVTQQKNELKQQIHKLEVLLQTRESKHEKELLKIRKEAQAAIDENRSLKTRVNLAEQAQTEAQTLENDYEEAVAYLENEIRDLRSQLKKNGVQAPGESPKQTVALACQLKKAEAQLKMYHAATEKLVAYVEHVQKVLTQSQSPEKSRNNTGDSTTKDKKKESINRLLKDGQSVIKLVKSLTESAPLPYGWEEAFNEDGCRYYINHVTQTTSWTHPTSSVTHIAENKPSTSKSKS